MQGWLGLLLHITPERLSSAERTFNRWGVVALVFGRHIIGLRVPLTVTTGILRIPYGVFASSVAVSSAVWAAILLELGVRYGNRLAEFGHLHRWLYVVIPAAFWLAVVAWSAIQHRLRRASAHRESPELREASTP